jgi:hypothetical protein
MTFSLNSIGLLSDILGVGFVAYSFIFSRLNSLAEQASTTWDANFDLLQSLCEQKYDNVVGFVFLLLGFVIQLCVSLGLVVPRSLEWVALLGVFALLATAVAFRSFAIGRFMKQAKAVYEARIARSSTETDGASDIL